MVREVDLNRLETVLDEPGYPVGRETAAAALADVTLVLAEGEVTLEAVLAASSDDAFESVDDLASGVRSLLPRNAVVEPYQSEGDGWRSGIER